MCQDWRALMSDFWARRKALVAAEAQADQAALVSAEREAREAELAEQSDEAILAEAGLAAPESLERVEEVQAFLKAELPRRLKTRALRRLWRLNPIFANLDGLVDYGEDFTDSAVVVENLQTVYQVGKGMFDKAEELARSLEQKALAEADAAEEGCVREEGPDHGLQELAQGDAADLPVLSQDPQPIAFDDPSQGDTPLPMSQRRMRFQFAPQEG